jgi:hypothetical protein
MNWRAELFKELSGSAGVVRVVVGQEDARDAGGIEPGRFDVAEEPVGVAHHPTNTGIDQGELIAAIQ